MPRRSMLAAFLSISLLAMTAGSAELEARQPVLSFDFEDGYQGWRPGPGTARVQTPIVGGERAIYAEPIPVAPSDELPDALSRGFIETELDLTGISMIAIRQLCDTPSGAGCSMATLRVIELGSNGLTHERSTAFQPESCTGRFDDPSCGANPDRAFAMVPSSNGVRTVRIEWARSDHPFFDSRSYFGDVWTLYDEPATAGYVDDVALFAAEEPPPKSGWAERRLTNDDHFDFDAVVAGSRVVWIRHEEPSACGSDTEIVLHDGGAIVPLTDDAKDDASPVLSDTLVAWVGFDGPCAPPQGTGCGPCHSGREIYAYDGTQVRRLTDDDWEDLGPTVSGSRIAWIASRSSETEIRTWDGAAVQAIHQGVVGSQPIVTNDGVVWVACLDVLCTDAELRLWNGAGTTAIATGAAAKALGLTTDGTTIAWAACDGSDCQTGAGDFEIFRWSDGVLSQLTDDEANDLAPVVAGGTVAWRRCDRPHGCLGPFWVDPSSPVFTLGRSDVVRFDGAGTSVLAGSIEDEAAYAAAGSWIVWGHHDGALRLTDEFGTWSLPKGFAGTDGEHIVFARGGEIYLAPESDAPHAGLACVVALVMLRAALRYTRSRSG